VECPITDVRICAIDSSLREDWRRLTDCRVAFRDRAFERSSTVEGEEKSRQDNVKDFKLVLVESSSRKALVKEVVRQWAVDTDDENRQEDCGRCCELFVPISFPPLMTSEAVELLTSIIRSISSNNWLLFLSVSIAQSKNLMLAKLRLSRMKILRRLWRTRGDHVQFQKVRCWMAESLLWLL
jgi:hypothetical protein